MSNTSILHSDFLAIAAQTGFLNTGKTELKANIGRRVRFIKPACPYQEDNFTIVAVQKDWRGTLCYRVVGDSEVHKFGAVAQVDAIQFID